MFCWQADLARYVLKMLEKSIFFLGPPDGMRNESLLSSDKRLCFFSTLSLEFIHCALAIVYIDSAKNMQLS